VREVQEVQGVREVRGVQEVQEMQVTQALAGRVWPTVIHLAHSSIVVESMQP
jgi:hypothetical protein